MATKKLLSVSEAAAVRGVTRSQIHVYIRDGRLPASRLGNQYVIDPADLAKVKLRSAGRPRSKKG
jgi:excisionase family DNA binding protein